MAKQFIGTEATGIYVGTLVEDMINTVAREKKLYCNVHIERFFQKDTNYPLTYVPFWALSLPLRKGDKVMVEFHQGNLMYPVLYKNPDEVDVDKEFYTKFNLGNIHAGSMPTAVNTVGATRLGNNSYIIKTDDYTVIHDGDNFILMHKTDGTWIAGKNVHIVTNGGKFSIDNGTGQSLYQIIYNTLNVLNTSLATQGSPAAHTVVPGQFTTYMTQLQQLME